ncbi:MAG: PEP-utilizing enzyme [Nitrospirae bacterium]|nr:PEP-utilizing enzyme [Nitrospirota bacterium]
MKNLAVHLRSLFGLSGKPKEALPPDLLFARFKEVLDRNNRTLEIITDMGEKLGGDYLFDITYVKSAYSGLYSTVHDSLLSFDLLTRDRYPRLHQVFGDIDARIKRMIYDISATGGEMTVFYPAISWDMGGEVGGKSANLAEVGNYLKLGVPPAFAITTHAFDALMRQNGLDEKLKALNEGPLRGETLEELRTSILNAEFPPALHAAIESALHEITAVSGRNCFLSVRSSAEEEDSDFSFAGQFTTKLNIPAETEKIKEAYREVVASLFSPKAVAYQKGIGYPLGRLKMAAACMVMVDAKSSGVIYSSNPSGDRDTLLINAVWGLGESLVEGQIDADLFVVNKGAEPAIVDRRPAAKKSMITARKGGGVEAVDTPSAMEAEYSLTPEQVAELARQAMLIERHFRRPQDIEWAIDQKGTIFILQARPLRLPEEGERPSPLPDAESARTARDVSGPRIPLKGKSRVVQKGTGAGKVFLVRHPDQLDNFPKGAVLVAGHDSSDFIRVMPYVAAIITDVGTPTSHMASLCREFRVPTVVNAGDATRVLTHGQEITLHVDDEGGVALYDGIRKDLLEYADAASPKMEDIYEFRKKRYILRYISPLNLVDPLREDFTPEGCKTMHDIIRFIHEKAVAELVETSKYGGRVKGRAAVKLDIPLPTGIMVLDIGGGLSARGKHNKVAFDQIASLPLRALLKGMMHPGVWRSDAVSLKVNDFFTSMIRMSDIVAEGRDYTDYNLAVVSREYVNLSLRFGYHFSMLDCYCSENARNNHIYFRFVGGATDIVKRSRRISLIAAVLREYGFNLKTKGDLIVARLANLGQDRMEEVLDRLGRLIAYTRQLDAVLHDDSAVDRYTKAFLDGDYGP